MFTGLIEAVGDVVSLAPMPGGSRLRLRTGLASEVTPGDSVAVNGACLTVTGHDGDTFSAELGPETMRVTALGALMPGSRVNLERSMRADARFGGHFVQGHVDGVGRLVSVRDDGEAHWLTVAYPTDLAACFVRKGSIAVNGISLTIADLRDGELDIMIIPFTWAHTALPSAQPGEPMNLEADVIGKYVARALDVRGTGGNGQEAGR
jgi:riboflavin synthase